MEKYFFSLLRYNMVSIYPFIRIQMVLIDKFMNSFCQFCTIYMICKFQYTLAGHFSCFQSIFFDNMFCIIKQKV